MNKNEYLINKTSDNEIVNKVVMNKDIESEFRWTYFLEEFYETVGLSWPILFGEIIANIPMTFNLRVAGRLGTFELAGATLSMTLFSVLGNSPLVGIMSALGTLQSQAYTGSLDKKKVGLYAQRAFLLVCLLMIPISILCWNLETILLALNQDPQIAKIAGDFLLHLLPSVPMLTLVEIAKRFLFIQGIMKPSLYISIIIAPFNIMLLLFLTSPDGANMGLAGITTTILIVACAHFLLHIIVIKYTNACEYWGGFSTDAFKELLPFISLGLPSTLMVITTIWPIEVISFTVSYFGPVPLSSQAILNNTFQLSSLFVSSLTMGTSIRIGNLLGANQPNRARMNSRMIFFVGLIGGSIMATGICIFRKSIIQFFSNDPKVLEITEFIFIPLSFGIGFDSLASISAAVLCGQGHQKIVAWFKTSACFLISLPLGWYLALYWDLGLLGLWIGIIVSCFYIALGVSHAVLVSDWKEEVERCLKRINNTDINIPLETNAEPELPSYRTFNNV